MRVTILKKSSTKSERRFAEILKKNHIPFQFRVIIQGREIDFLVEKTAIEIGDHSQDTAKNKDILEAGYSLLFISNRELREHPLLVEDNLLTNWFYHGKSKRKLNSS